MAGLDPKLFDAHFLKSSIDFEEINSPLFVAGLLRSGYDGLIVDEQGERTYAVVDGSQIIELAPILITR
jgi:hypothetical protein